MKKLANLFSLFVFQVICVLCGIVVCSSGFGDKNLNSPVLPTEFTVVANVSGQIQLLYIDEAGNKTRTQVLPASSGINEIFDYTKVLFNLSYFFRFTMATLVLIMIDMP
jgi:hypothetical protein